MIAAISCNVSCSHAPSKSKVSLPSQTPLIVANLCGSVPLRLNSSDKICTSSAVFLKSIAVILSQRRRRLSSRRGRWVVSIQKHCADWSTGIVVIWTGGRLRQAQFRAQLLHEPKMAFSRCKAVYVCLWPELYLRS